MVLRFPKMFLSTTDLIGLNADSRSLITCSRHRSLQLPARGIDIPSAWPANKRRDSGFGENCLEGGHALFFGRSKINSWPRIERNKINFAADTPHQLHYFTRMLRTVIHAGEQHVFERNA